MSDIADIIPSLVDERAAAPARPAPLRNNNPGALMPGGRLAAYATPEEGLKAVDDNLKSYGAKGVKTLAGVISRWAPPNENDTDAYIKSASQTTGLDPNAPIDLSDPVTRHLVGAAIIRHENGSRAFMKAPEAPQAQDDPFAGVVAALDDGGPVRKAEAPKQPAEAPSPTAVAVTQALQVATTPARQALELGKAMTTQATGIGHAIMGGWAGLKRLAETGDWDEAARAVTEPERAGMPAARTYQPEAGSDASKINEAVASPWNPMNWPDVAGNWAGERLADVGMPGTGAVVRTAANALPLVLGARAGARTTLGEVAPKSAARGTIVAPEALPSDLDVPTVIRRNRAPVATDRPAVADTLSHPGVSPEVAAKVAENAAPEFVEPVKPGAPVATRVNPAEQTRRVALLREVGVDQPRQSAVGGNPSAARTDFDLSRGEGPENLRMRGAIEQERSALTNYAADTVRATGGSVGTDGVALEARGNAIVQPIQGLKDALDARIKSLYGEADQRAPGVAADLKNLTERIAEIGTEPGTTSGEALMRGVRARLKSLGMVDEEGNLKPSTVAQSERFRQFLNESWEPQNSRLVRKLKDALDDDVTSAAGADIYGKARAVRAMRSAIFENDVKDAAGRTIPNGVARLVDGSATGVLRLEKPIDKIPDAIVSMPTAELAHVVKTLKSVPAEIGPQANAALAEIKAQFANRVLETGSKTQVQWDAPGVARFLKANSARMRLLFTDQELARFQKLNEAGNLLRFEHYPGAAVQSSNLMRTGAAMALPSIGAGAGAVVGSLVAAPGTGAAAGAAAGRWAAGKLDAGARMRAVEKRFVPLGEVGK